MRNLQELQDRFAELAIAWGEAFTTGGHKAADRLNSAITKIAKRFREDQRLGEYFLIPLFTHPNPTVRLFASVHALDQNIQVREAETVLTQIAEDPAIRLIPLMAHINLRNWIEKRTSENKDEPAG